MSPLFTRFLILAFAFILFERPVVYAEHLQAEASSIGSSELSVPPVFHADPLNSSLDKKSNTKLNPIAQQFIPVVLIAPTVFKEHHFNHYLPLFAQYRPKDYFLLI